MSFKRPGRRACLACVSSPLSKIPYVGFSPVRLQTGCLTATFTLSSLYAVTSSGSACTRSQPLRVGSRGRLPEHAGPEALGSPAGYSVPPGLRLLWPHPSLSVSPADFTFSAYTAGLCLTAEAEGFPNLLCMSFFPCRLPYPGGPDGGFDCSRSVRISLRLSEPGSASNEIPRKSVHARVRFRGGKVRFMLRPGKLLALHRQGLLRSSFHPTSHLLEMSSITTRVNSQFPRPDSHRLDTQHYGLRL